MSNVNIWCIVRDNRSVFSVTIGTNNNIFDLKVSIKDRKSSYFARFDADELWRVNVASSELRNNDTPIEPYLNDKLEEPAETHFLTLKGVMFELEVPEVPEQPGATAKRSYDDMQIDRTGIICDALIQPFSSVPSRAEDLMSLINAPLTRKLPVSFYEEIKFPQLVDFIETKNDERGSNLSKHISYLLTDIVEKQNLSNTSEDMLHWGMDSIIRIPLQIFHKNLGGGVLPIEMDRNSKDQGTTMIGSKRPDFLCWINNVLLFKGEEKAEVGDFSKAKDKG